MNRILAVILAALLLIGSFAFAILIANQLADSRQMVVVIGFVIWLPVFLFLKKAFDGIKNWK
jgi:hypothetical protein